MDLSTRWDIHLSQEELKGRTFLLGNKRAFSLALPAAPGASSASLHAHKWFGAYLYGRKFLEGQVVWARARRTRPLSARQQVGFTLGLASARREYLIEGSLCSEEFFLADGINGFAVTYAGDVELLVEPQFDMRLALALNPATERYCVEPKECGAIVSNELPGGTYDDATETFRCDDARQPTMLFAAIEAIGADVAVELLPHERWGRRKVFRKDLHRYVAIDRGAPPDAKHDHAPLWRESRSNVFAPVRVRLCGEAMLLYGFGASRQEALDQLDKLRGDSPQPAGRLEKLRAEKLATAKAIIDRAPLETGSRRVDTAYAHVLTRLMDALVARNATAEDTALDRPATMILAGNQYFHDCWKRDENIALGFLLTLGYYDLAREIIRDTWQLQDPVTGRLPQRIRIGEEPTYHSSDGTLWALLRLYQYWRYTGDRSLLQEKLPMVRLFFQRSLERCVGGLLPSGKTTAPDYLWETWMDTPHTPRDGFPVEIQMLWISTLRSFRPLLRGVDEALEARMEAAEAAAWHELQRYNVRGVPADSLDEQLTVRDLITPNAYFCFGVGLDLDPEIERVMRDIGRRELAGRQGIVTLAPADWQRVFTPEFLGDRRFVRGRRMRSVGKYNYHRGVEWNWLAQFFVRAELKYGEADVAFRKYLRSQVDAVLERGGIGGISELFDLSGAQGPEFQAWSMSGFLESLHAFAGVRIDVPERCLAIEPQLPSSWPSLAVRKWFGETPFDVRFARGDQALTLEVDFPHGAPADVVLEVGLLLPPRRIASHVDVRLDGVPQAPEWWQESVSGADRQRARISLPVSGKVQIDLGLRRQATRAAKRAS